MSCLKSEVHSSDSSPVLQDVPVVEANIESNEEYTELVQKSYETLFGPWLKPAEEGDAADPTETENAEPKPTQPSN